MSKGIDTQECFSEVMSLASVFTRPSETSERRRATARLEAIVGELAGAGLRDASKCLSEGLVKSPVLAVNGKSNGKLGEHLKLVLTKFRQELSLPTPNIADLIWKNAELLRGAFREPEYRRVILPFTVLRRLDCVLEPTKAAVLAKHKEIKSKNYDLRMFLAPIAGYPFWNTSSFTMKGLIEAPDNIRDNLEDMINGFSPNVRRIFEKFGFMQTVDKLQEKGRLFLVVQAFARTPMDVYSVSGHDMGKAFEELLRRFNEASPAGEQYTPRDVIHLMTSIIFDGDDEALSIPGVIRTMYDQTAGTGGMLSEGEEKFRSFNSNARLRLFGQELEDETYAICMADMLIRDQDPADIALGDTLADDKHPDQRFDYQLSNPPYGVEWKPAEEAVRREHARGAAGRFGPGLPRISDGQMLFQLNALSKMRPFINGEGGGRVGLVHNGSPLFTGDAGSGESEIRRYILEHDHLDAIVALPTDMFYNTNIATYIWFMSNRKPSERRGKVLLIDASNMGVLMKKNLGKKRLELSDDCQARITRAYHEFDNAKWTDTLPINGRIRSLQAKVLDASHFFYRKVTVERPLRMRFELSEERVKDLAKDASVRKLADDGVLTGALSAMLRGKARTWTNAEAFRAAIQSAADGSAKGPEKKRAALKAKQFEVARKYFGIRDHAADATTNERGEVLPDPELRDAEYVPFSALSDDVAAGVSNYMAAEVLPHWPDAWANHDVRDTSDGLIGIVGCEINFGREFYVSKPPRSREEIRREIEVMEKRFMALLKEFSQ